HSKKDLPRVLVQFEKLLKGEIALADDMPMKRKDGSVFYADVNSIPLKLNGKKCLLGIFRDVTKRKAVEEALQSERNKLVSILDSMADGVYIVDQDYNIQYLNPVLQKEFGKPAGRKCYTYFHDRERVCPWCKNPEVFKGKTVRWEWYSFKNDKTYDLVDTPIKNPDGTVFKLEIFRDITERKLAEEKIREGKVRLSLALFAANMGTWRWDITTNQDTRDENFNRILGLEAKESTQPV
ncbi:unnamed protein product, partial [marine sediment metagenome]